MLFLASEGVLVDAAKRELILSQLDIPESAVLERYTRVDNMLISTQPDSRSYQELNAAYTAEFADVFTDSDESIATATATLKR
jgi:hypothetical protein